MEMARAHLTSFYRNTNREIISMSVPAAIPRAKPSSRLVFREDLFPPNGQLLLT